MTTINRRRVDRTAIYHLMGPVLRCFLFSRLRLTLYRNFFAFLNLRSRGISLAYPLRQRTVQTFFMMHRKPTGSNKKEKNNVRGIYRKHALTRTQWENCHLTVTTWGDCV